MIVYGRNFSWGVMVRKGKVLCAVGPDRDTAELFGRALSESWGEEFEAIKLNDFEVRYCEPIDG
jgi:hypothetical protein